MKRKMFVIYGTQFPFDVLVCLGSKREDIIKRIDRTIYKLTDEEKGHLIMHGHGKTLILDGGQIILWTALYPKLGSGTLAHEIFHAVDFILDRMGVRHSFDSDEVWAYLIKYYTNEINKRI
jgi:hypothetical protein